MLRQSFQLLGDVIAPVRCPLCGGAARVCGACLPHELRAVPASVTGTAMQSCWSLVRYDDARRVVLAMKRRAHLALAPIIAAAAGPGLAELAIAAVTWAPTSPERVRRRGFDPAEVIARAVARDLSVPATATLDRITLDAQHGRSRTQRLEGPSFAVRQQFARDHVAGRLLLVDDVVTTGATLRAASACLRTVGTEVIGFTVAVSD
jgi:predicted amidophosphoribosyltransferase